MIRRALAFQHMDDEPPGLFGEFLREHGAALDIVMLHRGEAIPSLAPYDLLLVLGGAMDVWETAAHPWLVPEKAAIKEWAMKRNRPFLGICLGLQLLAEALGGEVGKARAEVGVGKVGLNGLGFQHPATRGLKPSFKVMQWHHAEVTRLPAGAEVLASSSVTPVQIMSVGRDMLATQFHAELTPALIDRWAHIPQYLHWLDQALGENAYQRVRAEALPLMPQMARMSRALFDNLVGGRAIRAAA
ncbi:MAG: type 1 glutamine amidotransferase [Rhizobiales bacterium]|nr:type 1 glutamine amidotransferase [Hyphomicrobiales bacterium]MBI3674196.1 type 1 glutamine amidotransferase [Hyphomicrobiales bacterium]